MFKVSGFIIRLPQLFDTWESSATWVQNKTTSFCWNQKKNFPRESRLYFVSHFTILPNTSAGTRGLSRPPAHSNLSKYFLLKHFDSVNQFFRWRKSEFSHKLYFINNTFLFCHYWVFNLLPNSIWVSTTKCSPIRPLINTFWLKGSPIWLCQS